MTRYGYVIQRVPTDREVEFFSTDKRRQRPLICRRRRLPGTWLSEHSGWSITLEFDEPLFEHNQLTRMKAGWWFVMHPFPGPSENREAV